MGLDRGAPDGLVGDDDALHFLGGHVHQVLEQLHGAHLGDGEAQGEAGVGERAAQGDTSTRSLSSCTAHTWGTERPKGGRGWVRERSRGWVRERLRGRGLASPYLVVEARLVLLARG